MKTDRPSRRERKARAAARKNKPALVFILVVAAIVVAVGVVAALMKPESPRGQVWSAEHGHYH